MESRGWLAGWIVVAIRLLLILLLSGCIVAQFKQYFRSVWLALRLPGPPAYPVIGNSYMILNHERLFYLGSHAREEYGSILRGWMSFFPVIFILEPQHIEKVLNSTKHLEKMYVYGWLDNLLGKGLVTSGGDTWRRHRRMLQPAFSLINLENMIPCFESGALALIDAFEMAMVQQNTSSLNIAPYVNESIFNILNDFVFGVPINMDPKCNEHNVKTSPFRKGVSTVQYRVCRPWLMFEALHRLTKMGRKDMEQRELLKMCAQKILFKRKQIQMMSKPDERKCLLDFLISSGLTDEECLDEASTFMLAGQDTVAGALTFTLYLLAKHQNIQEKAIAEVDAAYENQHRPCRENIRQLSYLQQCIKEALRLFPSVAAIGRKLGEDVEVDGYIIPAGAEVAISPYATHRLPEYFPDPETFNPDRFNPLYGFAEAHPYAYFPFSLGPRNCVGNKFAMMELITIISMILRRFQLYLPLGKEHLTLKYRVTIRAAGGVWINFKERSKSQPRKKIREFYSNQV